ncbi:MAG: hypothetical protein AB1779_12420 [Candidatus Thermoplasmatota archaeon]
MYAKKNRQHPIIINNSLKISQTVAELTILSESNSIIDILKNKNPATIRIVEIVQRNNIVVLMFLEVRVCCSFSPFLP